MRAKLAESDCKSPKVHWRAFIGIETEWQRYRFEINSFHQYPVTAINTYEACSQPPQIWVDSSRWDNHLANADADTRFIKLVWRKRSRIKQFIQLIPLAVDESIILLCDWTEHWRLFGAGYSNCLYNIRYRIRSAEVVVGRAVHEWCMKEDFTSISNRIRDAQLGGLTIVTDCGRIISEINWVR
jgi:hypothetical protein